MKQTIVIPYDNWTMYRTYLVDDNGKRISDRPISIKMVPNTSMRK